MSYDGLDTPRAAADAWFENFLQSMREEDERIAREERREVRLERRERRLARLRAGQRTDASPGAGATSPATKGR